MNGFTGGVERPKPIQSAEYHVRYPEWDGESSDIDLTPVNPAHQNRHHDSREEEEIVCTL